MNKRRFIFGMVLCLCMLIVAIPTTAFGQNYEVAVNQSQVLNIEGVKRVAKEVIRTSAAHIKDVARTISGELGYIRTTNV